MLKNLLYILFLCCIPSEVKAYSYQHFSLGFFTTIHVLVVNPIEHLIIPVRAKGKSHRQRVMTLAKQNNAVAAINGGFWKVDGAPAGALKINGQWLGMQYKPRGAIGWSLLNQTVLIDQIITKNGEVKPASNPPYTTSEEWDALEYIVGGTPVLLRNGKLIKDFSREKLLKSFLLNKHSRTAIGFKKNGDWVFVVVDSSFYGLLGGMTMQTLAQLMQDLGCIEALNLDGGSSSTLVIKGKLINKPCRGVETVSNAILIL